jgi:hypothetical protein
VAFLTGTPNRNPQELKIWGRVNSSPIPRGRGKPHRYDPLSALCLLSPVEGTVTEEHVRAGQLQLLYLGPKDQKVLGRLQKWKSLRKQSHCTEPVPVQRPTVRRSHMGLRWRALQGLWELNQHWNDPQKVDLNPTRFFAC